jgi:hypothetical protein
MFLLFYSKIPAIPLGAEPQKATEKAARRWIYSKVRWKCFGVCCDVDNMQFSFYSIYGRFLRRGESDSGLR